MTDGELTDPVACISNLYTRKSLSPPSQLHSAAKCWLGLSHDEIVAVIENHFADHRRLYTCGSGDGYFHMVEAAIRQRWREKHPSREHVDDEPVRPRRKRGVRNVYMAGGYADASDDREVSDAVGEDEGQTHDAESGGVFPSSAACVRGGDDCLRHSISLNSKHKS